jgi:hypothetical protein
MANPGYSASRDEIAAAVAAARGGPTAPDVGTLAGWTIDPSNATGTAQITTAGRISGCDILVPVAKPIGRAWFNVMTAGASPVVGQNFAALFDDAGNFLDISDDQSTKWYTSGATGPQAAVWAGGAVQRPAGWYRVGFFYNATTAPFFARGAQNSGINIGGRIRYWTDAVNTGRTTSFPATLAAKTAGSNAWSVCLDA